MGGGGGNRGDRRLFGTSEWLGMSSGEDHGTPCLLMGDQRLSLRFLIMFKNLPVKKSESSFKMIWQKAHSVIRVAFHIKSSWMCEYVNEFQVCGYVIYEP